MSILTSARSDTRSSGRPAAAERVSAAAPPKLRRRPVGVVMSVATVVLGALLGWWAWSATSTTTEVVAVRTLVHRGEVIQRDDLMVVRLGLDPAVATVRAARLGDLVGQRAALDLAPGGVLAPDDVAATVLPPRGMTVVGVGLSAGMLPAEPLSPGDAVRVVQTPGDQGDVDAAPVTISASVVGVHPSETTDQTIVDVLVPSGVAADLAARAASGRVAVVLDSRER